MEDEHVEVDVTADGAPSFCGRADLTEVLDGETQRAPPDNMETKVTTPAAPQDGHRRGLERLGSGRKTNPVHVWTSLGASTPNLYLNSGPARGQVEIEDVFRLTERNVDNLDVDLQEEGDKTERHLNALQPKPHVYCTVYCIANDNYRKSTDVSGTPISGDGEPTSIVEEAIQYPAPFTISHLLEPQTLGNFYNESVLLTCRVCLEDKQIKPLHCCKEAVCEECLKRYISSQVRVGRTDVICPITECSAFLDESTLVAHLSGDEVAKYRYFLELSRVDANTKPCPQCSLFTSLKERNLHTPTRVEHKNKVQCAKCQFLWCFKCHAPWHEGLKCKDYRKGDKLLRHWASVIEHGQRNAQKCPRCKIHIQRTEGCDHMSCTQCNTNFCYRCGEKYRQLRFFGDHTSNLSVFGCKYRYLPEKPHLRRLVRGSVCVSKILVAPLVIVLVGVFGALAVVIGLVALPIYCIFKRRRKRSQGSGRWLC